jgi:hypothetical protein
MGWLEFIAHIISSIAWPTVLIAVVVLLRRELQSALGSVKKIKYKEFEAEFADRAVELEARAMVLVPEPTRQASSLPAPKTGEEVLENLLRISPRVAVIESFAFVERAIEEAAIRHGLVPDRFRGVRNTLRELQQRDVIPEGVKLLFEDLRKVRNDLVHAREAEISEADAWRYIHAAKVLAARISEL